MEMMDTFDDRQSPVGVAHSMSATSEYMSLKSVVWTKASMKPPGVMFATGVILPSHDELVIVPRAPPRDSHQ